MKVSIEKTEHYALFILNNENLLENTFSELSSHIENTLNEGNYKYLIFDLSNLNEISSHVYLFLQQIHDKMITLDGLLLNTHSNVSFLPVFEENQLLFVPSTGEAVEYIYMDQLEKQFLGGDELED
ncbi:MAG: hypothetical protein CFE21_01630 [Bacteroidetes bacterium B1(2017)]|nr:MAG: hypothetical protein CFE21_01630 [Bacteroidetes bacterium B1(2017)]